MLNFHYAHPSLYNCLKNCPTLCYFEQWGNINQSFFNSVYILLPMQFLIMLVHFIFNSIFPDLMLLFYTWKHVQFSLWLPFMSLINLDWIFELKCWVGDVRLRVSCKIYSRGDRRQRHSEKSSIKTLSETLSILFWIASKYKPSGVFF